MGHRQDFTLIAAREKMVVQILLSFMPTYIPSFIHLAARVSEHQYQRCSCVRSRLKMLSCHTRDKEPCVMSSAAPSSLVSASLAIKSSWWRMGVHPEALLSVLWDIDKTFVFNFHHLPFPLRMLLPFVWFLLHWWLEKNRRTTPSKDSNRSKRRQEARRRQMMICSVMMVCNTPSRISFPTIFIHGSVCQNNRFSPRTSAWPRVICVHSWVSVGFEYARKCTGLKHIMVCVIGFEWDCPAYVVSWSKSAMNNLRVWTLPTVAFMFHSHPWGSPFSFSLSDVLSSQLTLRATNLQSKRRVVQETLNCCLKR